MSKTDEKDLEMPDNQAAEGMENENATPAESNGPADEEMSGGQNQENARQDGVQIKQIEELAEENNKLKKELSELKDIYQRMLAEYANYKRRTEQEKEQIGGFVKAETIKLLLPAIDSFELAVDAPPGEEYKKGIEMIYRQLIKILKDQGLEEISPLGETFNPELHHAVMREDAIDVEPDTVTEVFQKGYKLGDRIIRPAMVKVAN
ncbi:MAG TPA: nucleotide exchange factor GrpE [Candidatus Avimonas sp.]|mgnify:CR=1 FL=1|nr:nucleotide exchange factor GrpE [Clostridiales bacterium]HPU58536.1 nucleotide exchange factor GrpE [Candidatus Avimonas sp.]